VSNETHCYLVFPRVIVDHFVDQITFADTPIIPLYKKVKSQIGLLFAEPQRAMEQLCRCCIAVRFQEILIQPKGTFGSLLPFLDHSFVTNRVLSNPTSYCFPKIADRNLTTATDNKKLIKECLNHQYPHIHSPEVCPEDWEELLAWAMKGVLYIAAPKSASADAYVFWTDSAGYDILAFQIKSGATSVTTAIIIDECKKTFVPTLQKYRKTLVVAAASLAQTIPKRKGKGITSTEYAIKFDKGAVLKCKRKEDDKMIDETYEIPSNAQLIILLPKGLETFLSTYNIELIQ